MIPTQTFWAPFLWGLGVLLAWAGWGALLGRWLVPPGRRADLGLCAGWGLCAMLVVGGVLNALRLCPPPLLAALVVGGWLGLIPAIRGALGAGRAGRANRTGHLLVTLPLILWGGVVLAASLTWNFGEINAADDLANYLMYPVRMLQTGAVIEPFDIRRLSTFGGFAFLQAVIEVVGTEKNAYLLDAGLGAILVVLLLAGEIRRRNGPAWVVWVVAAAVWLYWMPRGNTMSSWIGTATVLTMGRTLLLRAAESDEAVRLRLLAALAMGGVATCSLRANYQPLPVVFLAATVAWEAVTRRPPLGVLARDALVLAASFAAMLAPWSVALHQAAGSPLYPLIKGNHRGEFFSYAGETALGDRLAGALRALVSPKLTRLLPGLLAAPLLRDAPVSWLGAAAVATTALTVLVYPHAEIEAVARYTVPLLLAPTLLGIAILLSRPRRARSPLAVGGGLLCAALLIGDGPIPWYAMPLRQWTLATVAWRDREPPFPLPIYQVFAEMQQSTRAGARIASVLDFPSLWDFRRNEIVCLDFPGAAVPHGPMPFFAGPEPLLDYLRAERFDYLAYYDFQLARGLYRADWYRSLVPTNQRPMNRVAVHALDFMENVDRIAGTQPRVFDRDGLRVIRIR